MPTNDERRLRTLLQIYTVLFLGAAVVYAVGPFLRPSAAFMRALPFVAFSVVKVFTLALACLFALGDPRRFKGLVGVALGGHAVSVAAMLVLLATADTTRPVPLPGSPTLGGVMWGAVALDLVITLVLALVARTAYRTAAGHWVRPPYEEEEGPLMPRERQLRALLYGLAGLFAAGAVAYELGALLPGTRAAFRELPFVTNSVVKVATLGLVAFYTARDVRDRVALTGILTWAHGLSVATQLLFAAQAGDEPPMVLFGRAVPVSTVLLAGAALDAVIAAAIAWMTKRALQARYGSRFLTTTQFRTLIAVSEVLLSGPDEKITPLRSAGNVDRYFESIRAQRRWIQKVVLTVLHFHPLLSLKPPLSEMDAALRLAHLKHNFYGDFGGRALPGFVKQLAQAMVRIGKQLTYVGYYSDPKVFASIGYVPYSQRPGHIEPVSTPHPLKVQRPADVGPTTVEADVCIIGSGAGGAVLAYHLAQTGARVVMVERGQYVEPRHFNEDEVDMIGKLYGDGVFQQTRDYRFTVLQGSCVGGSTVVNNAVSFRTPLPVLQAWNDPWRWKAGIDVRGLGRSLEAIEKWLPVVRQDHAVMNRSAEQYLRGVKALGLPPSELEAEPVRANVRDDLGPDGNRRHCVGCGYCNIGCKYDRKLSMLDTVLPWTQRDFPGKLDIYAECEVRRIATTGNGGRRRATAVEGRLADGRTLTVKAKKVVVSAGTIASSWILMKSGVGRTLPVGEGLCFNMGAPLTADFEEEIRAYEGLQISHYGRPRPERGWVFETWFNPPVAQALNMPGWFERHYANMRRYDHLMAVGILVGTESNGKVAPALTGGPDVVYQPTTADRLKLADAMVELSKILFAAGARRVMVNSWSDYELTSPNNLGDLVRLALDPAELTLGTGHPQGGNALSQDPERGVVGPDFRVHGYENLFVCDASVFPSSLTVNPQLTIMALAHYAAPHIAEA